MVPARLSRARILHIVAFSALASLVGLAGWTFGGESGRSYIEPAIGTLPPPSSRTNCIKGGGRARDIVSRRQHMSLALSGLMALGAARMARADLEFTIVSPDIKRQLKARDDYMADSLSKIDFAEEVRKQKENLAKKGTSEYDDTCKPENPCRDPPKNAGEALNRLLSDINNAEMGMMSREKLRRLGRDPDKYVNAVEQP
eukprot:CAMPEP_0185268280 /NCGR_PEP_ID=MMETSP1359-20130426/36669_1 /TAXON_ID=552665 /ORGANISM="Bigelowiella longifila, Strain CCMP242" /LENGTH=199 /DNA_ID=CAMNT_0027858983 /DNA_START=102 /DNA_END=701 /DNA_ORIENTATION=+